MFESSLSSAWQVATCSDELTPDKQLHTVRGLVNAWFLRVYGLLPGLAACASVLVTKYSLLAGTCVTGCLTPSDS